MSVLAMILTAAMVVPGDGPKMESGEIAEPQRLDLSGEWEGTWFWNNKTFRDAEFREETRTGKKDGRSYSLQGNEGQRTYFFKMTRFTDEGNSWFRFHVPVARMDCVGIYRQEQDRTILCYSSPGGDRPSSFRASDGQHLLILHRVKTRK